MIVSIWYAGDERNPTKVGYYYGRRYVAMAEDETGWFHWNGKKWTKYADGDDVRIAFWTEIDFDAITAKINKRPMNEATAAAFKDVQDAIDRYNIVKTLSE